ncbi:atherin-like isoform X2 [Triticum aestivum]|uniref:atherin-like isoform X2 n=1 Tax=Triticum aestivum TaxID=4565 RepID=UPI001D009E0F|nr:atherin-like isoform X2 [Triticum aestivum]
MGYKLWVQPGSLYGFIAFDCSPTHAPPVFALAAARTPPVSSPSPSLPCATASPSPCGAAPSLGQKIQHELPRAGPPIVAAAPPRPLGLRSPGRLRRATFPPSAADRSCSSRGKPARCPCWSPPRLQQQQQQPEMPRQEQGYREVLGWYLRQRQGRHQGVECENRPRSRVSACRVSLSLCHRHDFELSLD